MFEGTYASLKRNAPLPPFVFPLYIQICGAKASIKEIKTPLVHKQRK